MEQLAAVTAASNERMQSRAGTLARAIVTESNRARKRHGVGTVKGSRRLHAAARARARKQAGQGFMAHRFWERAIRAVGLSTADGAAENLSEGFASGQSIVGAYLNSAGHRRNLLDGSYRWIGVGVARDRNGKVWTCQLFLGDD